MQITDLHDAEDDMPRYFRGVKLLDGQLQNFYDRDLIQIMKQHDIKPVKTRVTKETPLSPGSNSFIGQVLAETHDWRLKKRMEWKGYDFAVIQIGDFVTCYDFYKFEKQQ